MEKEEKKQQKEELEELESHPEELEIDNEGVASDGVAEEVFKDTELDDLKEQLSQKEDQFLRAQAEIVNMRNRFQKERESLSRYRAQDLAKALLPAIDNLERALETDSGDGESLKKGVEMVLESLRQALKENGIEEIPALGEVFDPTMHQAVQTVAIEEGQKSDEIVQVFQKGYKLYDRILRPAMVIVAQ